MTYKKMSKIVESNSYQINGVHIPKALLPKVAPYVMYRNSISISEGLSVYRSVGQLPELKKKKKSDTLAILGSGASINSISESEWDFISDSDSLGLNWWGVYHNFVPDFYKYEIVNDPDLLEFWMSELNEKQEKYSKKDTTLIYDPVKSLGTRYNMSEIIKRMKKSFNTFIDIRLGIYFEENNTEFSSLLKYVFPTIPLTQRVLHFRGSLSQAIAIGDYLDYKNIVLFGVDLNNSEYFFTDDPKSHKKTDQGKESSENHATAQQNEFKPIDEYITHISEYIMTDTNIYIGNKSSLLYPQLEYYRDVFEI